MFTVKISDRCVQVTQDEKIVTVQRLGAPGDLEHNFQAVFCAVEALRGALNEVIRASATHHAVVLDQQRATLAATDGFHR